MKSESKNRSYEFHLSASPIVNDVPFLPTKQNKHLIYLYSHLKQYGNVSDVHMPTKNEIASLEKYGIKITTRQVGKGREKFFILERINDD